MLKKLEIEFEFSKKSPKKEVIKAMQDHFEQIGYKFFFIEKIEPTLKGKWDGDTAQYTLNNDTHLINFYFYTDLRRGGFSVKIKD